MSSVPPNPSGPAPDPGSSTAWGPWGSRSAAVDLAIDRTVRTVLLVILLVAGCATMITHNPVNRESEAFVADLQAHRVHALTYEPEQGTVTWTVDWWRAYRADIIGNLTFDAGTNNDGTAYSQTDGAGLVDSDENARAGRAWLDQQIAAAGSPVDVRVKDNNTHDGVKIGLWRQDLSWQPLAVLATIAGICSFLLMLLRRRRRVATRWAWFWLFSSGPGAVFYLLLEPEPLWRGRSEPDRERRLITGGRGFVLSLLLGIALGLVGWAYSSAIG